MIKCGDRVWVSDTNQDAASFEKNERIYVGANPAEPGHVCMNDKGGITAWKYVSKVVEPVFGEGCPAKGTNGNWCQAISNKPFCAPENCILEYAKKKQ